MSRWFRWYEGTVEDGKFRVVARVSRVTVRDVLALWAFMLEDAAHLDHRGVCKRNEDFMAAVLDFEDGEVERILSAMEDVGLVSIGYGEITVNNWSKRQFESDSDPTAARRKREQRERDRRLCHADVTRDTGGSDTDTDTERKTEVAADAAPASSPDQSAPPPIEPPKGGREEYAFEGDVIRLRTRDFEKWAAAYPKLNLRAELTARDAWLATAPDRDRERWFISTAAHLRNQNAKAAKGEEFKWASGIEGVY